MPQVMQEHQRRDAPGQRVCPEDDPDIMDKVQRYRNVSNAQCAPDRQHNGHGHNGAAQSAQDTGAAVAERKQKVEQRNGVCLPHAKGDHIGLAAERTNQPRRQQVNRNADALGQRNRTNHAKTHTLVHAVRFARTHILADKSGQCHRKAGDRQESKTFHLAVRAAPGHGQCAKRVDVCLHNNICQRDDRVLDAGGQALQNNAMQHGAVKPNLAPAHSPGFLAAHQLGECQNGTD